MRNFMVTNSISDMIEKTQSVKVGTYIHEKILQ